MLAITLILVVASCGIAYKVIDSSLCSFKESVINHFNIHATEDDIHIKDCY